MSKSLSNRTIAAIALAVQAEQSQDAIYKAFKENDFHVVSEQIHKELGKQTTFNFRWELCQKIIKAGDSRRIEKLARALTERGGKDRLAFKTMVKMAVEDFEETDTEILKATMGKLGYKQTTIATTFSQMKVDGLLRRWFEVKEGKVSTFA